MTEPESFEAWRATQYRNIHLAITDDDLCYRGHPRCSLLDDLLESYWNSTHKNDENIPTDTAERAGAVPAAGDDRVAEAAAEDDEG